VAVGRSVEARGRSLYLSFSSTHLFSLLESLHTSSSSSSSAFFAKKFLFSGSCLAR